MITRIIQPACIRRRIVRKQVEANAVPANMSNGCSRAISMAIFISFASTFLPMNSGVLPTIKPADKYGDDDKNVIVESLHLHRRKGVDHHTQHRQHAAQRVKLSCMALRSVGRNRRRYSPCGRSSSAKSYFFPLHAAPVLIDSHSCNGGVTGHFC